MATSCTHAAAPFTRTSRSWLHTDRSRTRAQTPGSPNFEVIDGMLYRRKLEKGFINYREVLEEERRHEAICSFHRRRAGQRHLTLEETYKCVAENYWWEGMYFQIRDVVLGCAECGSQKRKKNQEQGVRACVTKRLPSHSSDVLSRLKSQREAGMFCDITLRTSGRSYSAHKAVLAAVSDHFQELFTEMDASAAADMDFTGFSERSLLSLLDFSYSSTLKVRPEDLPEVVTMARHLGMWRAVEACSALMKEQEPDSHPGQDPASACVGSCQDGQRHQSKRKRPPGAEEDPDPEHSPRRTLRRLLSPQAPLSPSHRMKLLDFKSPSAKKATPPRSAPPTPPCTRLLRSSPGAARRLQQTPALPESPQRKKKPRPQGERPGVVKQEEVVLDDELDYARAQEKYKLMNVLGLQRTALLPRPEDLIGWRQKKRLRKLKANNYSLTKRRKPPPAEPYAALSLPLCAPANTLLPPEVVPARRRSLAITQVPPSDRSMRSQGLLRDLGYGGRELRRSVRRGDRRPSKQPVPRKPHRAPARSAVRVKAEPAEFCISGLASNKPAPQGGAAQETLRTLRYNSGRPAAKSRPRHGVTPEAAKAAEGGGGSEQTPPHAICEHPLYRVIKEEPADPLPVGGPFPDPPSPDLGKRQSKPPIKLLDSGFLFSFCRLKKEEESVDICLTRSVSQGGHHRVLRNRGPPPLTPAVKREEPERSLNHRVTLRPKATFSSGGAPATPTGRAKPKGSPHPASSRDSVRRARLKQLRGPRSQVPMASKSAHSCLQCPATYRDCDALIMHRLRHIEGKHWPCLLCSKTFFRLGNVRAHIRTHDPKLYKCRSCILAGS
ncbi:uncharacterized protein ACB058_008932 [Synchiropus picturatus]